MAEYYRNTTWNAEIEAEFEARIARARSQKAQHLRIQGAMLKDREPEVAIRLLERCIAAGDPFQVAPAWLDIAHAHYRLKRVDAALDALEQAIAEERREPMVRTSAPFDYPFLVALHADEERYEQALEVVEAHAEAALLPSMTYQAEVCRALILSARGQTAEAKAAAIRALAAAQQDGWIPGFPEVGAVPGGTNVIEGRLRQIAQEPA